MEPDDAWDRPAEVSAGFVPLVAPAVPAVEAAPAAAPEAGFDDEVEGVAPLVGVEPLAAVVPADGAAAGLPLGLPVSGDAAFGELPAAIFAGLPAALAIPAFEALSADEAAFAAPLAVAAALPPVAGVVADDVPPVEVAPERDSLAPLFVGAPLFNGAAGCATAAPAADVAACALVAGSPAGVAASPGLADVAALVLSPSLTVVFFSALRSIVWLRGLVGLDRRGRLVIASAPCSRVAAMGRDHPRRDIPGSLVLHSRAWRKRRVHIGS
ncbi:hypothetical protein [Jiella avicenniae]|uniref:hypothetical protein n=1 Tax=Jiella avicenniae TaxID=2907202 RepID=UPI001F212B09|nr:hypothetical protein [Jiella avicenniae]